MLNILLNGKNSPMTIAYSHGFWSLDRVSLILIQCTSLGVPSLLLGNARMTHNVIKNIKSVFIIQLWIDAKFYKVKRKINNYLIDEKIFSSI